ncbi:MmgE/PrpD family protein [Nocardioides marmotae]|nr:MmgE/PrpD family protein [Nocardioides marmotae]
MSGTSDFVRQIHRLSGAPLPEAVVEEATRALLGGVGNAIGAIRYAEVETLLGVALANGAAVRTTPLPGRTERVDPLSAATIVGTAAHIDDFDDTHLATVTHPTACVLAAAWPLLHVAEVSGRDFVEACALGMEAEIRVAWAMTPGHYDSGWHITSTVGVVGAAVTAGLLLGLDEELLVQAVAISASMTLGHREGFGTTAKSFHPGKAGANGLLAAHLARAGVRASSTVLEDPRGYFAALSPESHLDRLVEGLGSDFMLLDNTYKPYPCGVVSHPAIEAAEVLHSRLAGREVTAVRVHCHPLTVELAGNAAPDSGLSAKFSAPHSVAVTLIDGEAGLRQFSDLRVGEPEVAALRGRVTLQPDPALSRSAAVVEVDLSDGASLRESITAVKGSREKPLTDAEIDAKIRALVERSCPGRGADVVAQVRGWSSSRRAVLA